MEPPGIEPTPRSQSSEITSGRADLPASDRSELRGTPFTEDARAMNACDSPFLLEADLAGMIELASMAKRWALVAKLSDELARRHADDGGDVVQLARRRTKR